MKGLRLILAPIHRRLAQMLRAASVLRVNDAPGLQRVQVELLSDEVADLQRLQDYGFTSHPLTGAGAIAAAVGGRSNGYVVLRVDDHRYRIPLQSGEVAMYDDQGQVIKLGRNGIVITAPNGVTVMGGVTVTGDLVAGGISLKDHTHPGDSGGTTGAPQ